MLRAYRLQFFAPSGDGLRVVEEREIKAPNAGAAVNEIDRLTWPPKATSLLLIDLDGTVLAERHRR